MRPMHGIYAYLFTAFLLSEIRYEEDQEEAVGDVGDGKL